jgi:hypothetical protein
MPSLQLINVEGTVNVIVFPIIPKNTLLSPTVVPKLAQEGRLIDINARQLLKQASSTTVNAGKLIVVSAKQP